MSRVHGRTGATIYMDVVVEKYSCIFDTSAVHGGRMSQDAYMDIGGRTNQETESRARLHGCNRYD